MLFVTTLLAVRNQRILQAWNARQQENARRAAKGLPPRTRRRRRRARNAAAATGPRAHQRVQDQGAPGRRGEIPRRASTFCRAVKTSAANGQRCGSSHDLHSICIPAAQDLRVVEMAGPAGHVL